MPALSVIKPVEVVVDGLSESVPEEEKSELVRVVTDSAVYGKEYNSDLKELNNSLDDGEYDKMILSQQCALPQSR